jgi:geranylgeranyl reductase family protein
LLFDYIYSRMPDSEVVLSYDVVIAGAGPAGCACALALRNAGLRVAILDKQSFPRDKVCGDAIPGRAIKTLRDIDPIFSAAFSSFAAKLETKRTALNYKGRKLTFNWVGEAFTCARMQFDHFLFSLVTAHTTTSVYTNIRPQKYEQDENGITIHAGGGQMFKAKILIGADGAQSVVAKQLASQTLDRNHHVGSVRAYYHNVAGTISQVTEIFFNKKYLPSYLWVFPLPGNRTNVGFGMLSSEIARRKVNIKKTFYEFIEQTPELKSRFKDAVQTGDLEGFGLPLCLPAMPLHLLIRYRAMA